MCLCVRLVCSLFVDCWLVLAGLLIVVFACCVLICYLLNVDCCLLLVARGFVVCWVDVCCLLVICCWLLVVGCWLLVLC